MSAHPEVVQVVDGDAMIARLRALRTGAPAFTSNYFADPVLTARWTGRRVLSEITLPGGMLVLRRDRDFEHLYHAAVSPDALRETLLTPADHLSRAILVADLVDLPGRLAPVSAAYAAAGFVPHARLVRMARVRDAGAENEPVLEMPAELAVAADAPAIVAFLERLLDRFTEQIPEQDEVETLASAGSVLIVRRGAGLGGVLIFEVHGRTAVLRYWWVNDTFRREGIGARLIRTMFHRCREVSRIMLWVVDGNENAIIRYEHYGFRREGLVDQLMIRPGSEHR